MDATSPEAKTPRAATTVITCMDVRLDPLAALGHAPGDAHVLRNAGALVTDDVVRSLIVSQRMLGTRRIEVMGHSDCGLSMPQSREVAAALGRDLLCFDDVESAVRQSVERLRSEPDLLTADVHGYVYDVTAGEAHEISPRA
jgi:carbonic anhydrase